MRQGSEGRQLAYREPRAPWIVPGARLVLVVDVAVQGLELAVFHEAQLVVVRKPTGVCVCGLAREVAAIVGYAITIQEHPPADRQPARIHLCNGLAVVNEAHLAASFQPHCPLLRQEPWVQGCS